VPDDPRWKQVDGYIESRILTPDPALDAALADSSAAGLPAIAVSAPLGRLLEILARTVGASRVLEIGTLGGYSTIWLARGVPAGGRVVTLEVNPRHAEVARANLERAGVADRVEVLVGPALDTLPGLEGPFDLVFIDADKEAIPAYLDHSVRLARPGTLVVIDNTVRDGALADPSPTDPNVRGAQRLHEVLGGRADLAATTIQTVGAKGYDGFTLIRVEG
jgi:predicted O-methyltransferase YrrM